ncbi:hypothetical protein GDR74_03745 [Microvirga thermotolerans]|uniref:Uncharacterized protein n=2 Tax=Microvirga thermotolerans TaxID=2651334 RepID=A0A5P9K1S1_9HYPH|nr:hypothetical protein [Microvirga thermotolerans]QFU18008.1 hypothetical protein GDR74_03745 [Microvirga thermotolerans]
MDPPPPSDTPTVEMLKADIDSGRTGDKNSVYDPGLASLGADDEAAGTPASPFQVALARLSERTLRWSKGARPVGATHHKDEGFPVLFVSFIAAVAVVFAFGIWLVRGG